MPKMQIISIEGNIGSGKSTLLTNLKTFYNKNNNIHIIFLREPVDEWENIKDKDGNTMVKKFYMDQEKYSFSFQIMAYISRLRLLKDAIHNTPLEKDIIIITERSLMTDKMVFAKMLYDSNKIEDVNYQIYLKMAECFSEDFTINKFIYVKTNPEICFNRIKERSRNGECNIQLDYLNECSKYHEQMISNIDANNILILDGNINIKKNIDQIDILINEINNFILQ